MVYVYILIAFFIPTIVNADSNRLQIVTSECTTKATGGDGVRHGCVAKPSSVNAPADYVFAEKSLIGGKKSGAGSQHECIYSWDNYVEVIPDTGIKQPTKFTLYSKARSPKGHFKGRGWVECEYKFQLVKYK